MSGKFPRIAVLAGTVALSGALAGCGKWGTLERPGPLFGNGAGVADQRRQAQDPNRPVQTIDPRDQSAATSPPRTLPIPGSGSNPTAVPALPGSLPDPYANPPR